MMVVPLGDSGEKTPAAPGSARDHPGDAGYEIPDDYC